MALNLDRATKIVISTLYLSKMIMPTINSTIKDIKFKQKSFDIQVRFYGNYVHILQKLI